MIVTLSGENSFGLKSYLGKLQTDFVAEHGELGLLRLDGQQVDFPAIEEAISSPPFLASRKLVILRSPSSNKTFVGQIEQLFNDVLPTNDIVVVEPKLDRRLTYYKYLKAKTDFKEFAPLDLDNLAKWLKTTAESDKGSISLNEARYLVERVGPDQLLLSRELEKLLLYDSKITKDNIDLLTDLTPSSSIFELLEAAFGGHQKAVLKLYAEQRAQNIEPPQMIALIIWQLHVLAVIKAAGDRSLETIASQSKLNPYVLRKSQAVARSLGVSELKNLISSLLIIDQSSKRSKLDIDEALQNYLLSIKQPAEL